MSYSGISIGEAEANAGVFAAAFADLYAVDASQVLLTFAALRRRLAVKQRRLQASGITVGYAVLYAGASGCVCVLIHQFSSITSSLSYSVPKDGLFVYCLSCNTEKSVAGKNSITTPSCAS